MEIEKWWPIIKAANIKGKQLTRRERFGKETP
jgi:hypothetical protein